MDSELQCSQGMLYALSLRLIRWSLRLLALGAFTFFVGVWATFSFAASAGLATLQDQGGAFVSQNDPRAKTLSGGSCGAICAVNLLQGLRVSLGMNPMPAPYDQVRELFTLLPALNEGATTPQALYQAMEYLVRTHLSGKPVQLRSEMLDVFRATSTDWVDVQRIYAIHPEMIFPQANEGKILLVSIFRRGSDARSGHYLLVRDFDGNHISVVEPNKPDQPMRFAVISTFIHGSFQAVELIPEPGNIFYGLHPEGTRFVVWSILTASH